MENNNQEHPLLKYNKDEKNAYLCLLSALTYVDKDFNENEKQALDKIIDNLQIDDESKSKIFSFVYSPNNVEKSEFIEIVNKLKNSELKYTLISDLCLLAFSDDKFSEEEYNYILELAGHLDITKEQVDTIKTVQENLLKIKDLPPNSERAKKIITESAAQLSGAGVSIAAIAITGTTFGLSGAGIASGLAALGAIVGGGMLAGAVIVVPAIVIGTAYGVKKLINYIWKTKKDDKNEN